MFGLSGGIYFFGNEIFIKFKFRGGLGDLFRVYKVILRVLDIGIFLFVVFE